MRTASSNLTAHLASEVTTLAACWKLTLTDSTVMGFTDHTSDLTISSQLYVASTGLQCMGRAGAVSIHPAAEIHTAGAERRYYHYEGRRGLSCAPEVIEDAEVA